jgi:hypothetical protein
MRNIILGTVAGLLVGTLGSLAYTQYFGDGGKLADLQAQLDAANAQLAKAKKDNAFLTEEKNSINDQLTSVLASKPAASGDATQQAAATPAPAPLTIGGMTITPDMMRGFFAMMRGGGPGGGFRSPEQRMFLLNSRLKLDPDQAKAIRAAMDADNQTRRDAYRQARQNGQPVDQAALAAANKLDATMASVLTPAQQVQYQQLQNDEKQARAESSATQQVDNLMPLLQLSDDQKEKLMNGLYQQQLSAPDAGGLANNPNPMGALAQQGQVLQSVMKQVLSADQYALYQQNEQVQTQAFGNFGGGRRGGNGGGGNGGGGNGGGGSQGQAAGGGAPGAAPATTTATTDTSTPAATTGTTTTGTTTTDNSSSTNAPSATTNAASANGAPPPATN